MSVITTYSIVIKVQLIMGMGYVDIWKFNLDLIWDNVAKILQFEIIGWANTSCYNENFPAIVAPS